MFGFDTLLNAVSIELSRALTGKLFTDAQIRSLASHAVGKYFADWLPEPKEQRTARERVEEARQHIGKANSIITAMQSELSAQSTELARLLVEIEEKKKLAEEYAHLASTNKEQFKALRKEMEEALRSELVAQSEQGKRLRQAVSFVFWLVTLVLGAALGAYIEGVMAW